MRVTSIILLIAAVFINSVVPDGKVCYPATCGTYTSVQPGTTEAQLTKWTEYIGLDKFDNQGGVRDLKKVTIKTIFKFQTTSYVTCTNTVQYCDETYKGTLSPGVEFKMDLLSNPGVLSQYWGRWGDYPYGGTYASPGKAPNPDLSTDFSTPATPVPMFVEYTYPLFDLVGFTSDFEANDYNCFGTCSVWGYYGATPEGATKFYYGNSVPQGTIVSFDDSLDGGKGGYNQFLNAAGAGVVYEYGVGTGKTTPRNVEVELGTESYDVTPTGLNTPYIKTISFDDTAGGENQDILPSTVLALFQNSAGGGPQIYFRADAAGVILAEDIGGNSFLRQVTNGFVQMAIEYDYTGSSATQDPQFVGFQGQAFQVHGYPGSYFHLMSAPTFQMNGRFTYLANGHCNYKHTPCWTHPGTYIDDVTLIVDELLVRVTAGPVGTGYSLRINDEPFHAHAHANSSDISHTDSREFVPTKFYDAATRLTIHLRSPLQVTIRTDLFAFTLNNADHFFNIDSQLLVRPILAAGREASSRYPHPITGAPWFPEYPIHGFIGQTWANATYAHKKLYQGDVDDYVETRPYATESIYSQYKKQFDDKDMHWE